MSRSRWPRPTTPGRRAALVRVLGGAGLLPRRPGLRASRRSRSSSRRRTSRARCTWGTRSPTRCRTSSARWQRMSGFDALWLPGTRPRRHRDAERGRAAAREGGQDAARPRPRGVRGARLGVEGAEHGGTILEQLRALGASLRLDARALHDGRGPLARGARGLRAALREGPHLPRRPHHQLVPALPDRALRPRGGDARRRAGQPLAHPLSRPRAAGRASWSRRRGRRRCSATPRWRCTRRRALPRT